MWKIKNSLNNVTLKYFILFSIYILSFLWLFESIFFKPLYKAQRINDIEYVSKTLINNSLEEYSCKLAPLGANTAEEFFP